MVLYDIVQKITNILGCFSPTIIKDSRVPTGIWDGAVGQIDTITEILSKRSESEEEVSEDEYSEDDEDEELDDEAREQLAMLDMVRRRGGG